MIVVTQAVGEPPPVAIVKEPAESVDPLVMVAVGLEPQLVGVPMVGAVVWVDSR